MEAAVEQKYNFDVVRWFAIMSVAYRTRSTPVLRATEALRGSASAALTRITSTLLLAAL